MLEVLQTLAGAIVIFDMRFVSDAMHDRHSALDELPQNGFDGST